MAVHGRPLHRLQAMEGAKFVRCRQGHRGDLPPVRQAQGEQVVAQHAVGVQHGVDVPQLRRLRQGGVGRLEGGDGKAVPDEGAVRLLHEAVLEVGGAAGDHVPVCTCRLRQPLVRLWLGLVDVEHIQPDDRRAAVRGLAEGLQGHGGDVPAPLLIGPDLLQGPLVDAHQDDVPVRALPGLIPGVRGGQVRPVQDPQSRQEDQRPRRRGGEEEHHPPAFRPSHGVCRSSGVRSQQRLSMKRAVSAGSSRPSRSAMSRRMARALSTGIPGL